MSTTSLYNISQWAAALYSVADNASNLFGGQNSSNSPLQTAYAVNLGLSVNALIIGSAAQIGAGSANLGSLSTFLARVGLTADVAVSLVDIRSTYNQYGADSIEFQEKAFRFGLQVGAAIAAALFVGPAGAAIAASFAFSSAGALFTLGLGENSLWQSILDFQQQTNALFEPYGQSIRDLFSFIFDKISSSLIALFRDPLIIDLDGDGITLTALGTAGQEGASGVFFDYDGDGFGERTGWVSPNDGILVYDRNRNGSVDGASEIFGSPDQDGYAVLETLDSNGDGVIDAADRAFADLRVWRDLNGNGVADAGELQTLGEAGLASLNLTRTDVSGTNNGHSRGFSGVVTRTDGTTTTAETIYFQTDRRTTQDNTPPFTPAEGIDKLPQLPGSGQISAIGLKLTQDQVFRAAWGQREELRLAA
jgi:hypothetical protein